MERILDIGQTTLNNIDGKISEPLFENLKRNFEAASGIKKALEVQPQFKNPKDVLQHLDKIIIEVSAIANRVAFDLQQDIEAVEQLHSDVRKKHGITLEIE